MTWAAERGRYLNQDARVYVDTQAHKRRQEVKDVQTKNLRDTGSRTTINVDQFAFSLQTQIWQMATSTTPGAAYRMAA